MLQAALINKPSSSVATLLQQLALQSQRVHAFAGVQRVVAAHERAGGRPAGALTCTAHGRSTALQKQLQEKGTAPKSKWEHGHPYMMMSTRFGRHAVVRTAASHPEGAIQESAHASAPSVRPHRQACIIITTGAAAEKPSTIWAMGSAREFKHCTRARSCAAAGPHSIANASPPSA